MPAYSIFVQVLSIMCNLRKVCGYRLEIGFTQHIRQWVHWYEHFARQWNSNSPPRHPKTPQSTDSLFEGLVGLFFELEIFSFYPHIGRPSCWSVCPSARSCMFDLSICPSLSLCSSPSSARCLLVGSFNSLPFCSPSPLSISLQQLICWSIGQERRGQNWGLPEVEIVFCPIP